MTVTLIQATPDPIETIAKIASICYDSDPKNPLGLVKHLYRNGHHSVFEHIYFTFKIEGISRACSHQLVLVPINSCGIDTVALLNGLRDTVLRTDFQQCYLAL